MQFQVIFSDLCTGGDRKALAGSFHLGQTIPIVHSYTKSVMATYRQSYKLLLAMWVGYAVWGGNECQFTSLIK